MFQEYPKAIYSKGDVSLEAVIVFDAAEEAAKLKDGFEPAKEQVQADDVDALKAKAEELGIKVDARWGAKRLIEEIAKAE